MNGLGHAVTTLIISLIIAKLMVAIGISPSLMTLFVIGSFISCHSADVWGISAFSPDVDMYVSRLIGKNIHRKWYFHSYLLTIPVVWVATASMFNLSKLSALLFGIVFGWNAHIIEDDLWSRYRRTRKKPFPTWVEATSSLALLTAVLGVSALSQPTYYLKPFEVLEETVFIGFLPGYFGVEENLKFIAFKIAKVLGLT